MRWKKAWDGCAVLIGVLVFAQMGCWNPFAPEKKPVEGNGTTVELPPLTSPENVFENLNYAMEHEDIEIFEEVLDEDYTFFEPSLTDSVDYYWGKAEDVELVGKVFEFFYMQTYSLEKLGGYYTEYGSNVAPEGAKDISDEHPDENWEVFLRRVNMVLLEEENSMNGASINMVFEFKMRKQVGLDGNVETDPETGQPLWRIVRWIDHLQ